MAVRSTVRKNVMWLVLTLSVFSLFWWLFNFGMPGASIQFATGITIIITGGLLSGRYASRLWYKAHNNIINNVLGISSVLVIVCMFMIGFFITQMIGHPQFDYFLFTTLCLFFVSGLLSIIISMVRYRIKNKVVAIQSALTQSKTELQLLQSQLSPHFLFNTLNNLYGLSILDHQKVPALLLKLSDLLRYSVYEAKEVFVPIREEVNYLKNYIEFEQIRLGARLSLTVEFPDLTDDSMTIAPMLLIVFVENAFKHSKNNEDESIFINLSLKIEGNTINFLAINSCSPPPFIVESTMIYSGFGLESVRKRLNLLYAGQYNLTINALERTYYVNLKLKTQLCLNA